jgi:hypothetical protein
LRGGHGAKQVLKLSEHFFDHVSFASDWRVQSSPALDNEHVTTQLIRPDDVNDVSHIAPAA